MILICPVYILGSEAVEGREVYEVWVSGYTWENLKIQHY